MNLEKDRKACLLNEKRQKEIAEAVNHPSHYLKNGKECIDAMIEDLGIEAVIHFCRGNSYKYRWRAGLKKDNSSEQDLAKAEWYDKKAEELTKLLQV